MSEQPSLFSVKEQLSVTRYGVKKDTLALSADALTTWKQRIFQFQRQITISPPPEQGSLFDLAPVSPDPTLTADPHALDPFSLPRQNTEFWRWQASDAGIAALYFVIDDELPIVLYVGETVKSNQRWKGEHDCKRYLMNYVTAHRPHDLPVSVNIAFWLGAPTETRPRQKLESALIEKWRSPFNKENWEFWGTPFVGKA